ncbi:MAG: GIY-YIG nuclease family protein [Patescibacteria group bacterium]|nr:GIY-YIG nuclease family protein [Patescibacteria group bacterium]
MFYIYAIYNKVHGKTYIGQTRNLAERLSLHNKHVLKGYTSRFDGEWKLIYSENVTTRQEALKREKQLKSYRGREFIKSFIRE